jgi:hypothetical protein
MLESDLRLIHPQADRDTGELGTSLPILFLIRRVSCNG